MKLNSLKVAFESWFMQMILPQLPFLEQVITAVAVPNVVDSKLSEAEKYLKEFNLIDNDGNIDENMILSRLNQFVFNRSESFSQKIMSKEFTITRQNIQDIINAAKNI